jgi:hypothetical protein
MEKTTLQPLGDLANPNLDETELELARRFVLKNIKDFILTSLRW